MKNKQKDKNNFCTYILFSVVAYLFSLLSERSLTLIDHDKFCSWTLREIFIRKLLVNAFHLKK